MNTTAGSWALLGAKVPTDATVVQKLRAAGAVILGKTNLSQWANWRSFNTPNGWSALDGQAYGPYYPHEDPSGSSSGSGIAAPLGLAAACVGTETDGSLVDPAADNNIVSVKPTVGLTSRHLAIPLSEHQDTVDPMARTVKDAALLLQAITGPDPYDNYTSIISNVTLPDYLSACKLDRLSGMWISIPRNVIALRSESFIDLIVVAFTNSLKTLESAEAVIIDDTNFPSAAELTNSTLENTILNADFIVNLQTYSALLTFNPNNITSLASLREFTQKFPLEYYPLRDTFWPAYRRYRPYADEGGLLGALNRYNLDAVILPTRFTATSTAPVGAPIVTVPLGFYPASAPVVRDSYDLVTAALGTPFGLSFLGAPLSEAKLIGMVYAYKQRTKTREKAQPYIFPTTELQSVIGAHG